MIVMSRFFFFYLREAKGTSVKEKEAHIYLAAAIYILNMHIHTTHLQIQDLSQQFPSTSLHNIFIH